MANKPKKTANLTDKNLALAAVYSDRTSWRGKTAVNAAGEQLQNIKNGILPYHSTDKSVSVRDAVILTQKAYFNVSVFRNTIDTQTEFANSKLRFRLGSKKSIALFNAWYDKIKGQKIAEQFFREYYRSSNFFAYKTYYKVSTEDLQVLRDEYGSDIPANILGKEIPLRYMVLNPADIEVLSSLNYSNAKYGKLLNSYEANRLKNPQTQDEKEFFASLPEDAKKVLKSGGNPVIELNQKDLVAVFAKKLDYEPMAVPIYFPVLFDIDLKLEFKKIEHAIARTIDYVVLMVTTGDKDNGVDARVVQELQNMFKTESVGRVIVADYSTKAEFVTPDLNKVLGPEKYQVVNADIANGLMNIFFEDQKFANSYIKTLIFLERLNEARKSFIDEFLVPEMKIVAEALGLRDIPEPYFEEIDISEQSQRQKVYTRLAELGILTPEELFETSTTGVFPDKETSLQNQEEYKKLRDKGYFAPLVGGSKAADAAGRPNGSPTSQKTGKPGIQKSVGSFSLTKIKDNSLEISKLIESVEESYKKKINLKRLSSKNKDLAYKIAANLVSCESKDQWFSKVDDYVNGECNLNSTTSIKINEIMAEHNVDTMSAAILLNSLINNE